MRTLPSVVVLLPLLLSTGCSGLDLFGAHGAGATESTPFGAPTPEYPLPSLPADATRFEPNLGQFPDEGVRFGAHAPGYELLLTDDAATLHLGAGSAANIVRLAVLGGSVQFDADGWTPLPGLTHYLTGAEPADWITHVPGYGHVRLPGIRQETDLLVHATSTRQLEFDLVLRPGADPSGLGFLVEGADALSLDPEGSARLETAAGEVVLEAPRAYQPGPNGEDPVDCSYALDGMHLLIEVGVFDPERTLVVDPVVVYQEPSGLTEADGANAVATEPDGTVYIAGRSRQLFPGGYDNAIVSKRNANGDLVWETILGHQFGRDEATAIAFPPDGTSQPVVAGHTTSCFFPGDPCGPTGTPPELAAANAFVVRLTSDGSGVVFGDSFGGSADDRARGVAVGGDGAIHVVGRTSSTNFPNAGRFSSPGPPPVFDPNPYPDYSPNGADDAFVTRFSATGALQQAGYLGGTGDDEAIGVVIDGSGRPVLVGNTTSANFPHLCGGYAGRGDVFVTRFATSGRTTDASFYAQGPLNASGQAATSIVDEEIASAVAMDEPGRLFVAGTRRTFLDLGELGGGFRLPDAFVRIYQVTDCGAVDGGLLSHESIVGTFAGSESAAGLVAQRTNIANTTRYFLLAHANHGTLPQLRPTGAYSGANDFYLQVSTVGPSSSPELRVATYLGTSGDDLAGALAVDRTFSAIAAGRTISGTSEDALVARVQLRPSADSYTALEDVTRFGLSLGATVLENDAELFLSGTDFGLEAVVENGPSHAALFEFFEPGTFRYRGLPNFSGTDSFTYRVVDGDSLSAPTTVTLTVQSVDDDPPEGFPDTYSTAEDTPLAISAPGVLANDVEHDGQSLSAELVRGPELGGQPYGSLSFAANGNFLFSPPPNGFTQPGMPVTFEYLARDAGGTSAVTPTLVAIAITPVNDPPGAVADYFATPMGVALAISAGELFENDLDIESGGLFLLSVQNAVGGTISLSGDIVTFTPSPGFFGPASFTYTASDDAAPPLTATGVVTVLVSRPPSANDDSFALPESGTLVVAAPGVLTNDADPDGESLSAALLAGPAYGTLVLHPLGGFSYVADRDFPGSDSFSYRALDAGGVSAGGPATVTIAGTPRSEGESVATNEDSPVVVDVLSNDPGLDPNAPPETEVAYCYDGFDAACGGSDAPATAFVTGRLTRVKDKPGEVAFAYDGAGRPVRETRTLALPGETRSLVSGTDFDENGNPISRTHPTGLVVERVFDETDREVSISLRAPGGLATPLLDVGGGGQGEGWYPSGRLRAWRAASGTLAFTVEQDASGWVTRTSVTSAATGESAEATYRYSSDGNVIAIDSPTENNVGHDSLGRVTFDRGLSYSYDDAGNRLGGPGGAVAYPDPSSNRWSSAEGGAITYEFDIAGNVTRRGELALLTADDGTLIGLDSPAQGKSRFFRDHRNLRLATAGASGNERFVHSDAGDLELRLLEPIAEMCGAGQVREVTPVEHYVYLGGRRVAMVAGRLEGACGAVSGPAIASVGESHFYFADKMDLARAVYRESDGRAVWRGEFDAFAVPVGAGVQEDADGDGVAFAQPFRLPGQQEIRGTELHENWNRVFDRVAGRYLQPDLTFLDAPLSRDMTDGAYFYALNSPLAADDPTGLEPQVCCRPLKFVRPGSCVGGVCMGIGGRQPQHCWLKDGAKTWGLYPYREHWWQRRKGQYRKDDPRDTGGDCAPCKPKDCDAGGCFNREGAAYPNYAKYSEVSTNSNTFAGNPYRKCCEETGWKPGNAPGWDLPPPSP